MAEALLSPRSLVQGPRSDELWTCDFGLALLLSGKAEDIEIVAEVEEGIQFPILIQGQREARGEKSIIEADSRIEAMLPVLHHSP